MDYTKTYNSRELFALYTKCAMNYDIGNFSFKNRLVLLNTPRTEFNPANISHRTEMRLFEICSKSLGRRDIVTMSYRYDEDTTDLHFPMDAAENLLALAHMNNYYIVPTRLYKILGFAPSECKSFDLIKKSGIYEAFVTFMIACTHYSSIIQDLAMNCVKVYTPYDCARNLESFKAYINGDKSFDETVCAPVYVSQTQLAICPTLIDYTFSGGSAYLYGDTDCFASIQALYNTMIFGVEVLGRIESIPSKDLRDTIYRCMLNSGALSANELELTKHLYYKDDGTLKPVSEVQEIIDIKDKAKRYEAIRAYADKFKADILRDAEIINKNSKYGINPVFAELIKFAEAISIYNYRVKAIVIMYEKLKKEGMLDEFSSVGSSDMPLPSSSKLKDMSSDDTSEEKCMWNPFEDVYGDEDKISDTPSAKSDKDDGSLLNFEVLDKLNASFNEHGYSFKVSTKTDFSEVAKDRYDKLANDISLLNANLIRSIKDIKVYNTGGKNTGKKAGKLDRKNLYKYRTTKDIFYDNTYKTKESDLAFGIILDVSGSMRGKGITNGVSTMICLHETLKALNINHCIITHTSSGMHQSTIDKYQTFKEDKTYNVNKNYAIADIKAKTGNCDSAALYYMEKELLRTKNKDKICIIFSDGEPTECTGTELVEQVRHMERSGIRVIGIGIDFESIKEYYPNNANGKNLREMFDIVSDILKQYVLERIDKE